MKQRRIVEIVWDDAHCTLDSADEEELELTEPCTTRSVGWVMAVNQHGYVIAMDTWYDPRFAKAGGTHAFIPHGMIKEVRDLKYGKRNPNDPG